MRYFVSFLVITLLIFCITGFYSWYIKKDNIENLKFLQDLDWSWAHRLDSISLKSFYDCAVDSNSNLHIVWTEYDTKNEAMIIKHEARSPDGQVKFPLKTLISTGRIQQMKVVYANHHLHVFYIGKGEQEKYNLEYIKLNLGGQILTQKTVLINEYKLARNLQIIPLDEEEFFLAWTDRDERYQYQLKGLRISVQGQVSQKPMVIVDSREYMSKLRLKKRDAGYHLAWRENVKNKDDTFHLYYQPLDGMGNTVGAAEKIATGNIVEVEMAVGPKHFYLVWNRTDLTPGFGGLFVRVMQHGVWAEDGIKRITSRIQASNSAIPALAVDSNGQIHVVTRRKVQDYDSLAHQIFSPGFSSETKTAKYIYPQWMVPMDMGLLMDESNHVHLWWKEGHHLYYGNMIDLKPVSPLQLMGFDVSRIKQNLWQSLFYIFSWPLISMPLYLCWFVNIVFLLAVSFLLALLGSKLRFKFKRNLYIPTFLLCLIEIGLASLAFQVVQLEWFITQLTTHFWFIMFLSLGALLIYMLINKVRKFELMFSFFLVLGWTYWIMIIALFLNLPYMNFVSFG